MNVENLIGTSETLTNKISLSVRAPVIYDCDCKCRGADLPLKRAQSLRNESAVLKDWYDDAHTHAGAAFAQLRSYVLSQNVTSMRLKNAHATVGSASSAIRVAKNISTLLSPAVSILPCTSLKI